MPAKQLISKAEAEGQHRVGKSMLRATLLHIPGIGQHTEFRLWSSGISDWSHLQGTRFVARPDVCAAIQSSEEALRKRDAGYFFSRLPATDRWRVYEDFGDLFAVVDIETTGLSIYDNLTLIGIESRGEYRTFVRGSNLEEAIPYLESVAGLITFNGTLFDLPFLRRTFPGIQLPVAHFDLRFLGRRTGLVGPLKNVEQAAGLFRDERIRDISGYKASVLWSQFTHGDPRALELLVKYNAADTCNLRALCQIVVGRLHDRLAESVAANARDYPLFPTSTTTCLPSYRTMSLRPHRPKIGTSQGALIVNRSRIRIPQQKEIGPTITLDALLNCMKSPTSRIVGIDLSGSEARPSGWALLEEQLVVTRVLRTTSEIVRETLACRPDVVSIDSPLAIPLGRDCTSDDCTCRRFGISRQCERELRRRGISVYWCLVPSMQALTKRGMLIASELRHAGVDVIESYPGAAQDIMRIPRKGASHAQLRAGLASLGIKGIRPEHLITHDELDAVTSALVGSFYLAGLHESLGSEAEGYLIVPQLNGHASAMDNSGVWRLSDKKPLLIVVAGERAEEVADLLFTKLPFAHVSSVTEAEHVLANGGSAFMVTQDPNSYRSILSNIGPKARCIATRRGKSPLGRRGDIFADLIVDGEVHVSRRQIDSWLDELRRR